MRSKDGKLEITRKVVWNLHRFIEQHCFAKVTNDHPPFLIDEEVVELQVPMYHILGVEEGEPFQEVVEPLQHLRGLQTAETKEEGIEN